jgi:hypothetical protein
MEFISNMLPTLWAIVDKRKCAINFSFVDNELSVTILNGKKKKTFLSKDHNSVMEQLQKYLTA